MSGKIYKVRLIVDAYYQDEYGVVDLDEDITKSEALNEVTEAVLNIVEHAEDNGLLQPDNTVKLMTWHSVVNLTDEFADELPSCEDSDGL